MDDLTTTRRVLTEMAELLNANGVNYSVSLRAYSGVMQDKTDISDIISGLIGEEVVIGGVQDLGVTEVTEALREYLGYPGDESAGPDVSTLESVEFSGLLNRLLESVAQLSETSFGLKSFWFAEGHPAYPVFWDFAFLFLRKNEHCLLVGSSSD